MCCFSRYIAVFEISLIWLLSAFDDWRKARRKENSMLHWQARQFSSGTRFAGGLVG